MVQRGYQSPLPLLYSLCVREKAWLDAVAEGVLGGALVARGGRFSREGNLKGRGTSPPNMLKPWRREGGEARRLPPAEDTWRRE